jgi:hypothetical protein
MSFSQMGKGGVPGTPYTSGSPVTYQDFEKIRLNFDDHQTQLLGLEGGSLFVLATDPTSPVDGQAWLLTDGGSPETILLRIRRGGLTYTLPLGTLA